MEQSNKEFLSVLQGVKLSKTQSPTTAEDRKRMEVIPYASAIGSIKYAMLCTRSIVYPTLSLAREYNSDLGVDLTAVKIMLRGIRILSVYKKRGTLFCTPITVHWQSEPRALPH